jgi:inner membrane protein
MASLFTHVLIGALQGGTGKRHWRKSRAFWLIATLCSMLPDLDVIGFKMGVHYGDLWGHRGMTHSLLFAAMIGVAAAACFHEPWQEKWKMAFLFFVITATHGVLDALTNGGLGVAFFSPFDTHRYFFPWRPIQVSPIGIQAFFTQRGLYVMKNELLWFWCPVIATAVLFYGVRALLRMRNEPVVDESAIAD